ncbi:MAG: FprA family A-type flavoprotein, partial [candidate division WOR-3 bacterium]
GYTTNRGTTYNAYLILADKITLIDTVKSPFKDELLSRIASVINPVDIDYIISNHAEMDHSGALPAIIEAVKPEKVFASANGVKALREHFHFDYELVAVQDGDTLDIGNLTLKFLETRMLHWPDSMVTYLVEDELLFSQDGFGMHLAHSKRFADETELDLMLYEAKKYYANILLPYSGLVAKLLERIKGLSIKTIAPDHGPIWRKEPETIVRWYRQWAEQQPGRKLVIAYDTMWHSTALMAQAIADGAMESGVDTKVMPLRASDRSAIMTEILDAGAVAIGSPTINNGLFPTIADLLTYMKGLKPRNKVGATFGSYGWSGEASSIIAQELHGMGWELVGEPLRVKFVPDDAAKQKCRDLGRLIATRVSEKCNDAGKASASGD